MFFKILFCVLKVDSLQQCFVILSSQFTCESPTWYWTKIENPLPSLQKTPFKNDKLGRWHSCQYLLWPPCAANTGLHLLGKDRIICCIQICGILCHSCCNSCLSLPNRWGGGWRWRTCLWSSSQWCSMGFKSGDFEGDGNILMLFWVGNPCIPLLYGVGPCPA